MGNPDGSKVGRADGTADGVSWAIENVSEYAASTSEFKSYTAVPLTVKSTIRSR